MIFWIQNWYIRKIDTERIEKPQFQPKMFKNVKMNMFVLEKMFKSDERPEWKRDFERIQKVLKITNFRVKNFGSKNGSTIF